MPFNWISKRYSRFFYLGWETRLKVLLYLVMHLCCFCLCYSTGPPLFCNLSHFLSVPRINLHTYIRMACPPVLQIKQCGSFQFNEQVTCHYLQKFIPSPAVHRVDVKSVSKGNQRQAKQRLQAVQIFQLNFSKDCNI